MFNRFCGIDVHEVSPGQIQELFPYAKVDDLKAGFYVKEDSRVDPIGAAIAMAKGARLIRSTTTKVKLIIWSN